MILTFSVGRHIALTTQNKCKENLSEKKYSNYLNTDLLYWITTLFNLSAFSIYHLTNREFIKQNLNVHVIHVIILINH